MKRCNPLSRNHLHIRKADKVLDLGSGNFPHPRAQVIVDKFVDDNTHREADANGYSHQTFIQADAQDLPFADNEFDYVICTHVLEHSDDPAKFIKEMCRVAKRGYLETPSIIGELLIPKESHKWVLLEIDGKVIMYEKGKIGFISNIDFGEIFLGYFPRQSLGWKILQRTHRPVVHLSYEWEGSIDFLINPEGKEYKKYFMESWTREMVSNVLPKRTFLQEAIISGRACMDIARNLVRTRFNKKVKTSIKDY